MIYFGSGTYAIQKSDLSELEKRKNVKQRNNNKLNFVCCCGGGGGGGFLGSEERVNPIRIVEKVRKKEKEKKRKETFLCGFNELWIYFNNCSGTHLAPYHHHRILSEWFIKLNTEGTIERMKEWNCKNEIARMKREKQNKTKQNKTKQNNIQ